MSNTPEKNMNFLLYHSETAKITIQVIAGNETVWLTQKSMGELFGVNVPAISKHLSNIFEEQELQEDSVVSILETTATEIIYNEADAQKLFMGLTSWKNAPEGKILKSDVCIAKNYLSEQHIKELEQIVSAYLDLAENRTQRQILMKMDDWTTFLNGFLELSNYPILHDQGKITQEQAKVKAEQEFNKYRVIQDQNFESDFDKEIKK
ncbi:RhuM family protein [Paraflavitalea speifideaquila]|uniref:RhuM family protein n=1 Tax=Paraflavitalea speifideaquila TaxID=3076558 RepID=UPI0028EA4D7B|nr:RhuM family protein [Paraflavitalea speifideiaquila]